MGKLAGQANSGSPKIFFEKVETGQSVDIV